MSGILPEETCEYVKGSIGATPAKNASKLGRTLQLVAVEVELFQVGQLADRVGNLACTQVRIC